MAGTRGGERVKVSVPAGVATGLAALFSLYHLLLATTTLFWVGNIGPVVACMVLYAAATGTALFVRGSALPVWAACFSLATAIMMPLVAAPVSPADAGTGQANGTWWVAAVGTLMVILVVRQRAPFAWVGVLVLAVTTLSWAGIGALGDLGVLGSVSWVVIATAFTAAMNRATRIQRDFIRAEQETVDWQAAQDAHVFERQFRLSQTTRMARPMLQRIIDSCGGLTDDERTECLHLEQAIRDEIRGRSLLSDDVRDEVMRLRRRGAVVQLHDDGGLDELEVDDLRRIHSELADALRQAHDADNVIVRTVPEGADAAVTVVGLRLDLAASESAALGAGLDDEDDDDDSAVAVWLEIPRHETV